MYNLLHTISIAHHITITHHRYREVLLELIDTIEVRFSGKCLFVRASMYGDEISPRILESLTELY